jgi:hypothetical protein
LADALLARGVVFLVSNKAVFWSQPPTRVVREVKIKFSI